MSDNNCSCGCNNYEKAKISKKNIIILIIATLFLALGYFLEEYTNQNYEIVGIVLMAISCVIAGYKIFFKGLLSIKSFKFDENVLMTIAIISAFCIGEFEEAGMVALLFRIGEIFENHAVSKSHNNIKALADIRTDKAWIFKKGKETFIDAKLVNVGDIISVHPHDLIPLDGKIIKGETSLDSSYITGESMPVRASENVKVLSGMMNGDGLILVEVEKTYSNSTATRIINMVNQSYKNKGEKEKTITKFARYYTPIVVTLAIILTVLPPILGFGSFFDWFSRALVFLVASCPCALVISIPLSYYASIGAASKFGVLIKGGRFVEALAKVNVLAFDKTRTLTNGKFNIKNIYELDSIKKDEILKLVASIERYSSHPIAQSMTRFINKDDYIKLNDYHEYSGLGVSAQYNGKKIICGGKKLMKLNNIDINDIHAEVFIAIENKLIGAIELCDELREETKNILSKLKKLKINKLVMLTGDTEHSANEVAKECGIDEVYSQLLPDDKLNIIKKLKEQFGNTAFVGDGINDVPVLTESDCGIAMGFGSQAAIESSDMVLTSGTLKTLPKAIKFFKRTMSVIYFNVAFALSLKAIVLILAAFGIAPMWLAIFADVGVTFITIINSTRLLKAK